MIHFRCSCTHFRLFLTQMIYRIVSEVSQYKVAFKNLGSVFEKKVSCVCFTQNYSFYCIFDHCCYDLKYVFYLNIFQM